MRLDSYAIRLSLLAPSRHVPPGLGFLPLSWRHGVALGVEDEGSGGDPAPEHLGKECRRETSLETSVEGRLVAALIRAEREFRPGTGECEVRPRHRSVE